MALSITEFLHSFNHAGLKTIVRWPWKRARHFFQIPKPTEKNANGFLTSKGGIAVVQEGNKITCEVFPGKRPSVSVPATDMVGGKDLRLLSQGHFILNLKLKSFK